MRKKIVAGNWKMNKTFQEADDLVNAIEEFMTNNEPSATVVICPPFPFLELSLDITYESDLYVGAQNISDQEEGAYTGEVSASMLKSMGIEYCIVGHSERRKYFKESNELLAKKVDVALKNKVSPIFCCGEVLPEREAGNHFEVVKSQINEGLFHLSADEFSAIVIAYEPVWAIGTGVTASSDQAQEMHAFIRGLVKGKYGEEVADETSILYGGSCNAKNAAELFANPDVDGGLIGGASLKPEDFIKIIEAR